MTVTDACAISTLQNYSITINAVSLGRNDSIATATVLPGNGTYSASISPSGDPNTVFDPDEDFYRITTTAASTVTVDINAVVNGSPLDSVIEITGANGVPLNACVAPAFNSTVPARRRRHGRGTARFLPAGPGRSGRDASTSTSWTGAATRGPTSCTIS